MAGNSTFVCNSSVRLKLKNYSKLRQHYHPTNLGSQRYSKSLLLIALSEKNYLPNYRLGLQT